MKQILAGEPNKNSAGSYSSIDVGFSVKRPKKYCDFVGFHAKYSDPKTGVRFYNSELFPIVQKLNDGQKDQYLSIRKANVILK